PSSRSSLTPPYLFGHATAPTEIYPLSLHDALPISGAATLPVGQLGIPVQYLEAGADLVDAVVQGFQLGCLVHHIFGAGDQGNQADRKSTRLNSSHVKISYAVFCLKKKKYKKHQMYK